MKFDIVRAWKDEAYRQTLSEDMLDELPANPAGELELSDACLDTIYGGDAIGLAIPSGSIVSILSNIRLFSVNVLSNPFNQTCFQNR